MSSQAEDPAGDGAPSDRQPRAPGTFRLAFLLKHAHLRIAELMGTVLAPYGIDGRELAVLATLTGPDPLSQQEVAGRLGIDRTTMVALADGLERKRLVARRSHPGDRRKNIVALTGTGRDVLGRATQAADDAERRFLAALAEPEAQRFRDTLHALLVAETGPG